MRPSSPSRKIIKLKTPAPRLTAEIEYRVAWNEICAHWEILRNGTSTNTSRRKKRSAIDLAILAIQSEENPMEAKVIVTSLKNNILKTEWIGPQKARDAF